VALPQYMPPLRLTGPVLDIGQLACPDLGFMAAMGNSWGNKWRHSYPRVRVRRLPDSRNTRSKGAFEVGAVSPARRTSA
jgi:hypothetical protein